MASKPATGTGTKHIIAHKQLANLYGVHPATLTQWIKKIAGLKERKRNKVYTPKDQQIIYSHLGNPLE